MTYDELANDNSFVDKEVPKTDKNVIIKVLGVGGGGGNAVSHMYRQGLTQISYALCNTDRQAMEASPVPTKVVLGPSVTKGLGAGNNPKVAAEAAEESVPEITKLFQDGTEMVFITAGMGGGTGTGAAPVVARVAHELGILTIGIVTIPFLMEGEAKILKAMAGAKEMSKYVDALLVVNNEILIEQFGELDFITAFAKADDTLSNAAKSIAEIIYTKGHINLDFKDVETTLRNSGVAVISTGYGEGEKRVSAAIKDALNSPLLRKNDIASSKRILFNIYTSDEPGASLKMSELSEFREWTKKITGLDLIYGVSFDNSLGNKVKISILAAGFKSSILKERDDDFPSLNGKTLQFGDSPSTDNTFYTGADTPVDMMTELYGKENVYQFKQHKDAANFVILSTELCENDSVLEMLEATPAYNRAEKDAEDIRLGRIKDDFQIDSIPAQQKLHHEVKKGKDDNIISFF